MHRLKQQQGFSLLEIITALALVAMLVLLAVPSWQQLIRRNQQAVTVQKLLAAIRFAMLAAETRAQRIIICPSDGQQHCGSDWQQGWLIATDLHNDHSIHSDNRILQSYPPLANNEQLQWQGFAAQNYLIFYPQRHYHSTNGHFLYWQHGAKGTTKIILNRAGRVRIEMQTK